jgi:hypothetical protein
MTDVKNTIDYINDLYEDINEEAHFDYEDRERTKVYTSYDEKEEFKEVDLIHIKYNYDFYFTKEFRKVIKDVNKYEFIEKDEDFDEDIHFTFPRNSSHLVTIQSGLKIPYEEIHSLIINKAKEVSIQLIQTSYIKYLYEENEKLVRDNKKIVKMYDGIQQYIINLSEENIQLKKRMDQLETTLSNFKLGIVKKVPKTVI